MRAQKNKSKASKRSTIDRVILFLGYSVLALFTIAIVIPLAYVVIASFMDPNVLNNQGISFRMSDWSLEAYRRVLEDKMIWRGFANSFFYSITATAISVFITLLAAYPMSKKDLVGRKFFNALFVITMFFGGGLIPTFILMNQLRLFPMNYGKLRRLMEQMRYSTSSRFYFHFANQSLQFWHYGDLLECGTVILMQ